MLLFVLPHLVVIKISLSVELLESINPNFPRDNITALD